jgi:hypothetical protein
LLHQIDRCRLTGHFDVLFQDILEVGLQRLVPGDAHNAPLVGIEHRLLPLNGACCFAPIPAKLEWDAAIVLVSTM